MPDLSCPVYEKKFFINRAQIISNGTGDYTKEKYENTEELTIEDSEKFLEKDRKE